MTRDAQATIEEFWRIQDSGDYTQLVDLFAEDAVLFDPVYGQFDGREAIAGFMSKMVDEMGKLGVHFVADEIVGAGEAAWCRWKLVRPDGGTRDGVGIYKVRDGQLTYYRDYMDPEAEDASAS